MRRIDLFWGALAQFLNVGAGLIVLPIALRYMSRADVGLWFTFISLTSLVQLLELGFQPSIARAAAYVNAGASSLHAQGFDSRDGDNGVIKYDLLLDLTAAAKFIYKIIASAAVLFSLLVVPYIYSIVPEQGAPRGALLAWSLMALGSIGNFYFGYYGALLQGRGEVAAANKSTVYSKMVYLASCLLLLMADTGLIGLGVASLSSAIAGRACVRYFYIRGLPDALRSNIRMDPVGRRKVLKDLWPNSSRLGLTNLGAFLILRSNTLVAASFLGLEVAASFGLAVQLYQALLAVSIMPIVLQMPHLSSAQVTGNKGEIKKMMGASLFLSLGIYGVGSLFICFMVPDILVLMGSKTVLPDFALMALLSVVVCLELNHGIFAYFITTFNRVPFVRSAIISGVGILLLSLASASWTKMGVLGLVVSQGLVQLSYNNWKWPVEALKGMGISWWGLICLGLLQFRGVIRGR
jgi:O-antigen/teichoic acid export membrane protein